MSAANRYDIDFFEISDGFFYSCHAIILSYNCFSVIKAACIRIPEQHCKHDRKQRIQYHYPSSYRKNSERWADKVSATDSPREENGCNYSGKNSKKENKTG